jgi:membrane-associated phospholipid phosphatase
MDAPNRLRAVLAEADLIDHAVYRAVASTRTPVTDRAMRRLSLAANYSRIWIASAAVLAASGPRGRVAAGSGLASVAATSVVANLIAKPLSKRPRPDRDSEPVAAGRHVTMPASRSFPSGHAASAAAFASAAGRALPPCSVPVHCLAALVAYSRVHTGVHYPGDVIAGVIAGAAIADLTGGAVARRLAAGAG